MVPGAPPHGSRDLSSGVANFCRVSCGRERAAASTVGTSFLPQPLTQGKARKFPGAPVALPEFFCARHLFSMGLAVLLEARRRGNLIHAQRARDCSVAALRAVTVGCDRGP